MIVAVALLPVYIIKHISLAAHSLIIIALDCVDPLPMGIDGSLNRPICKTEKGLVHIILLTLSYSSRQWTPYLAEIIKAVWPTIIVLPVHSYLSPFTSVLYCFSNGCETT